MLRGKEELRAEDTAGADITIMTLLSLNEPWVSLQVLATSLIGTKLTEATGTRIILLFLARGFRGTVRPGGKCGFSDSECL